MNELVRPQLFAPPTSAFQRFDLSKSQLDLIWDMNRDLNPREFDQFIETSKALGLNPLARQICSIVFNKNKPDKRQMAIVTTIMGLRAIADRTGTYRPDDQPARFTTDKDAKDPKSNPHGLVDCIVTPYRYSYGEWHPVVGQVWWDETAPIREYDGVKTLDSRTPWPARPRAQFAKCAEAAGLRLGWPENLSNVYAEDEVDRARVIDITPSQAADEFAKKRQIEKVQPANTVLVDMWDGKGLQSIPVGQFHDRVMSFIKEHGEDASGILTWMEQQRLALQQYHVHDKAGALDLKRHFERLAEQESQHAGRGTSVNQTSASA